MLTLAHSPDSDDLVMWWPLTGQHAPDGVPVSGPLGRPVIDTGRIVYSTRADDIERLNARAKAVGDLDITAISAHAYPYIKDRYRITAGGGSFGEGYGPKVVVRADSPIRDADDLRRAAPLVGVPGVNTTAFLTLGLMLGGPFDHSAMLFSDIPAAVVDGRVGAGLLIHEAQLTFADLGLRVVADVGEWWTGTTALPLPLGLNVVKRDLDARLGAIDGRPATRVVSDQLSASIAHARSHADESYQFLVLHGADRPEWTDRALVDRYLKMYVSDLTLDMGERGRTALERLFVEGHRAGLCPDPGPIDIL